MHRPVFSTSSPGKILLTGEYFVLWGATAYALPTLHRHYLNVFDNTHSPNHQWTTWYNNQQIFSCEIDKQTLEPLLLKGSENSAHFIKNILQASHQINPAPFAKIYHFDTRLTFAPEWGLGSSSSLIVNFARFIDANPFVLHRKVSKGSGYDVACAHYEKPLLFQNPENPEVKFVNPDFNFTHHLYFLPLNIKKDSQTAVNEILSKSVSSTLLQKASEISKRVSQANDIDTFSWLLSKYTQLVVENLRISNPLEKLFDDFSGTLKPLGAWGGDLVLVASREKEEDIRKYFTSKGYPTLLKWHEVIKTSNLNSKHE